MASRDQGKVMIPAFLQEDVGKSNLGLWWERYGTNFTYEKGKLLAVKHDWIEGLSEGSAEHATSRNAAVQAYAQRIKAIAEATQPKGVVFSLPLATPLVLGMGISSPIENSLMFHHTLGCPYIPGSSIKGLVQAFIHEWVNSMSGGEKIVGEEMLLKVFGQSSRSDPPAVKAEAEQKDVPSADKELNAEKLDGTAVKAPPKKQRGSVIFMDAIPLSAPRIMADVMTPHIGNYLQVDQPRLSEAEGAKPIFFPVVAPGIEFQFTLCPADVGEANGDGHDSDCVFAAGWLVHALENIGIGAKTKANYGRFLRRKL